MKAITFQVFAEPKGQPRPKAFARNMGGGKFAARVYDPGTAEAWKSAIAEAATKAGAQNLMADGPIRVSLWCHFARPKSHLTSKGALKPTAPKWKTSKPDADNIFKAATDALTQIGVWRDDAQIVSALIHKKYAHERSASWAEITISEMK